MNDLSYSELESRRFGLRVFRGHLQEIRDKDLLSFLVKERADVVIFRIPAEERAQLQRLDRMGFPYLIADDLVYYTADLAKWKPADLRNTDMEFRPCTPVDEETLNGLVAEIFVNYTNHYHANPFLDKKDILEGYKEWARNHIAASHPDKMTWLVYRGGHAIAFATCAFHEAGCEGVLYGVKAEHSGGGVYGDLIRFTQRYFRDQGMTTMKVSTQVQNYAVQKVWAREGFYLSHSYITVHINPLLSATRVPIHVLDYTVTEQDIELSAQASGDRNPLHFDSGFAKSQGFADRFAHGLVANGIISKYAGMVYPGSGTLFMGFTYRFFKPMIIHQRYRFEFTVPFENRQSGFYKSVVKVLDAQGSLCLVAYLDLYKKS